MNRHLHSPTKLTEFAREFEEEPETLFTKFVNKLTNAYNTSYNTVNELQTTNSPNIPVSSSSQGNLNVNNPNDNSISRTSSISSLSPTKSNPVNSDSHSTPTSSASTNEDLMETSEKSDDFPIEHVEGRTMVNVLKRISNIVATKNNNLRNYKDTDLQRLWMPDAKAKECYDCAQKFTTFRRKHHCRLCGQIFCSKCCNQVVPGKIIRCSGDLKVCTYCSKIVLSYLKSPDITTDLKADLQALQENLSSKLDQNQEQNDNIVESRNSSSVPRKISVGYQEERLVSTHSTSLTNADRKNILQQSNSLKTLHEEMFRLLPMQNCGVDLINFLKTNQKSSTKIQAIAILNAMLEAGFLAPIVPDSDQIEFDENLHYKLIRQNDIMTISGNIQLDVNYGANSVHMSKSYQDDELIISQEDNDLQFTKSFDESIISQSINDIELENSIRSTTTTAKQLVKSYCDHEELLLSQMLRNLNLDQSWSKILIPLCARTANQFRPEYLSNDSMDIRNYVNFKKVPGGVRHDSTIVGGVVFSKNVAHKAMTTRFEKPKVLLLQCPIVYERVEGKFVSIETLLLQEKEYLRNVTQRILNLKPNVVLVHKNVAGIAQDMLRSAGITLVLDVKISVMERLSRCMQCEIVTSIESKFRPIKLGSCDIFYIQNFDDGNGSYKTLMFFEMLSSPRGCCCLLRGTNNSQLAKVKKVASMLVNARYNWRLEMSFLLDEFARPPSPKRLIFDSKEHTPSDNEDDLELSKIIKSENTITKTSSNITTPEIISDRNSNETFETNSCKRSAVVERKNEEKFVTIENVNDFSDPLRAPVLLNDDTTPTKHSNEENDDIGSAVVEFAVQTPFDYRFRTALSSTVLSVSPYVSFPLPYLETEQGRKCTLRSLFPIELYFSKQWSINNTNIEKHNQIEINSNLDNFNGTKLHPSHPFVKIQITTPFDNREIQTLLAEFRAFGGRYPKSNTMSIIQRQESFQRPQKVPDDFLYLDALDMENHQRLPVLFCSFYYNPKATSSCCAQPTLLDMKFYNQQDIMLGQFLERYCFRSSYICPSCNLPMMDHVRRYVHSMGCVQVSLTEDVNKNDTDKIFLTSVCSKCINVVTPSVPISDDTRCLSFAKYLELRFHGHAYKTRSIQEVQSPEKDISKMPTDLQKCPHSLHRDYIHYFSYKGIIAKFTYSQIDVWEIGLPSLILILKKPKPFDTMQVLEDIKSFSMKGHEVYSKIHEKIAELATEEESQFLNSLKAVVNHDQFTFRQHIEIVQTLLTEKIINSYDINDAMLMAKRCLAESIELWVQRLNDAVGQVKALQKLDIINSPIIDSSQICTEDLKSSDMESPTTQDIKSVATTELLSEDIIKNSEIQTENDTNSPLPPPLSLVSRNSITKEIKLSSAKSNQEYSSDKKTIKKMLSQLMPSNGPVLTLQSPLSSNEHLTLPLGAFPILVHDQDLSSIIAYSLTTNEYKKAVEALNAATIITQSNEGNNSPNMKRKSNDGSIDSDDKDLSVSNKNDDDKKSVKPNSHIELYFQDLSTSFTCKIYFAREFDNMRSTILKPPKLDKSIYKELEANKKREEIRMAQKNSSPEIELIRKTSSPGITVTIRNSTEPLLINSPPSTKEPPLNQSEMDETRIFLARSLCRSMQWEARGGKSGSKFSKTLDDRFVLKEMSQKEVTIFENFAPNYFEYIEKCLQQNQPTLLAKIFGVFRVAIKKKDFVQEKFLLVMENLFYDCDIKNKFDLKGSERNRLVDTTNQNGEIVLLDENLLQMSWSKPLYILSHSKTILKEAINRDASFLEKNEVMDYSLLVGLNNKESVLVLGIIDYIRTFTFDKKVESFVKQSGLLGGQGKLPTVISPGRYKQRFIEAMDRYFYSVPDRWEGLSKK